MDAHTFAKIDGHRETVCKILGRFGTTRFKETSSCVKQWESD